MIPNNNLLINAVIIGDLDTVKALLNYGASIHIIDEESNTLMHLAAVNGHLSIVEELLNRGAPIDIPNINNLTPFELANNKNKLEVVSFLLNCQSSDGKTLLHYAIIRRNQQLIDLLLEKGANVNVQDKEKNTPLHVAVTTSNQFIDETSDFVNIVKSFWIKGLRFILEIKMVSHL